MDLVVIESPYAGVQTERNRRYLRACLRDSLLRGEAPFASHGLYTQPGVLSDDDPNERSHGIKAGFMWRRFANRTAVYTDLGISAGMQLGLEDAQQLRERDEIVSNGQLHQIEFRSLGENWDVEAPDSERSKFSSFWQGC